MNRALWTLLGCCAALHAQTAQPGQNFPWALANGAWTFFTDPRAVYHKGQREKVYLGAFDRQANARVWSYDFATSAVGGHVALDSLGRPVLAFVVAPTESNHRY